MLADRIQAESCHPEFISGSPLVIIPVKKNSSYRDILLYMSDLRFQSKSPREELDIILSDKGDFQVVRAYLEPLIKNSIHKKKFSFNEVIEKRLFEEIVSDIPVALDKFLAGKNATEKGMSFSVYFTWYIGEHINAELEKRSL
jgi:hypothetical protein